MKIIRHPDTGVTFERFVEAHGLWVEIFPEAYGGCRAMLGGALYGSFGPLSAYGRNEKEAVQALSVLASNKTLVKCFNGSLIYAPAFKKGDFW